MKTLSEYLHNKTGLDYYRRIAAMTEKELSELWEEVDKKAYWWYLEFYIPARQAEGAFAGGEPTCDGVDGTIHEVGAEISGRFFLRPAYVEKFDAARYVSEIKRAFHTTGCAINTQVGGHHKHCNCWCHPRPAAEKESE